MKKIIISILILLLGVIHLSQAQFFDGYLKEAVEKNKEIQALLKQYEAEEQSVRIVSSLPDPQIAVGAFVVPIETRVGAQWLRFSISQMFPWFGTLQEKKKYTILKNQALYQQVLLKQLMIEYQLAKSYFPLYKIKKWEAIEEENIKLLESYKKVVLKKIQGGVGELVDVLRVELLLKEAVSKLAILKKSYPSSLSKFNLLMDRDFQEKTDLPDSLVVKKSPIQYQQIDTTALKNHPSVSHWRLEEESAEKQERIAAKQSKPNFGVGLDYIVTSKIQGVDFQDNGKDAIIPKISLTIPIHWKKYQALKKKARLMRESYKQRALYATSELVSNYQKAKYEIAQALENIDLYTQQIKTQDKSLALLFASYANSGDNFEEVLRAERQLLEYKKKLVEVAVDYRIALAYMQYVVGGNI